MDEEVEGKGFVVRDRRSFSEEGESKEETQKKEAPAAPEGEESREEGPPEPEIREPKASSGGKDASGRTQVPPLPEVSFSTLIMSLSSSALLHLGEIPDPETGQKKHDLPLAKHTIDTIGMLHEKTRGNLTEEEQKFLDSMLTDLRWRFVKASG